MDTIDAGTAALLRLFGPPRLEVGGTVADVRLRRGLAMAAWLGATGRPCPRDRLAALVWPDSDAATAQARLRRTLHALNEEAGTPLIVKTGDLLTLAPGVTVDTALFRALAAADDPAALARAVDLAAEDFLAGFGLDLPGEFTDWTAATRETLRQELDLVLSRLAEGAERAGDLPHAVAWQRRRLALDPLREPVHRAIIRLHGLAGEPAAALRQYEELVRLLDEELGVAPGPETAAVFRRLTETAPAEGTAGGPKGGGPGGGGPGGGDDPFPDSPIRYARSGDMTLAWRELGGGPVDVVLIPGFVSHLKIGLREPGPRAFLERLARSVRLILFDRRGLGLSERLGGGPTPEATQEDIAAVMDAAGSRRAVLAGFSEGGPASLMFAARHPERVRGLILYGTLAKGSRASDYPHALPAKLFDRWLDGLVADWGGPAGIEVFAPSRVADAAMRDWFATLLREGCTPAGLRSVMAALRDTDVRRIIPEVKAPALVIHRRDDRAIRVGAGRDLARRLANARYVELPGEDHWWFSGDADALLEAIQGFLAEVQAPLRPPHAPARRVLAAVLAVEAPDLLRPAVAAQLGAAGGRLLPAAPDGALLAAFEGATAAAEAARRLAAGETAGRLCCGIAVGECADRDGTLTGPPVQAAIALAGEAAPGETRLSDLARAMLTGV